MPIPLYKRHAASLATTHADVEKYRNCSAHATGLPYLRHLLSETQSGAAISSHGAVAVRVPVPERFAVHKLIVAQLRVGRPERSRKDLQQAAVLIAACGELMPGALEDAFGKSAVSSRKAIRKSLEQIAGELQAHPQAWEEISKAAKRKPFAKRA